MLKTCFRGRRGWSLVLLLGTVNAACGGYRRVPDVRTTPEHPPREVPGTPLLEVWRHHVSRGLSGATAMAGDTVLYVASADRHVTAVDLRSGVERWKLRIGGPAALGVLRWEGLVIVPTELPDGRIHALNAVRGSPVWKSDIGPANAPLAVVDDILIVLGRDGRAVGINPRSGQVLWRQRTGVARAPAMSAGAGQVFAGTLDSLFLLESASGHVVTRRPAPGPVVSRWLRAGDLYLAGTTDSQLVAVRVDDLTTAWTVPLDAPVTTAPVIRDGAALVVTRIGSLYRIPLDRPASATRLASLRWPATTAPLPVGDLLVLGGADGTLQAVNPDGAVAWQMSLTPPVSQDLLRMDDGLLAIGGRGDLVRYRQ